MPQTAKLFMTGQSQAVHLPVEFRFEGTEVFIEKQGDSVVLRPKRQIASNWLAQFYADHETLPDDFLSNRNDTPPQNRSWFDDEDA